MIDNKLLFKITIQIKQGSQMKLLQLFLFVSFYFYPMSENPRGSPSLAIDTLCLDEYNEQDTPLSVKRLLEAAKHGDSPAVLKIVKDKEAELHATNIFGQDAFIMALLSKQYETVREIIESQEFDTNSSSDLSGRTPLMAVAAAGNADLARLILEKKPNLEATNSYGQTAREIALTFDNQDIIALIDQASFQNLKS